MSILAAILAVLALAGAAASWVAGALIYRQASKRGWLPSAFWIFASKSVPGAPPDCSVKLNKATIAFFTCAMLAVAATSVATNLSRLSH